MAVVVNWNRKEDTLRCLRSLQEAAAISGVIVVDNGSMDGSVHAIRCHFPGVEVLALDTNLGFAAACNRAIEFALNSTTADYIFFINNDAVVDPLAVEHLLAVADAHPVVGVLAPKIYYLDRPRRIWYAGARRRNVVLAAADTGRGQIDHGQFTHLREVDYTFGAAMLVRRSVFEEVGLFDERFFLYLEDLDFCLRVQLAGFSLLFVPQAHVWHSGAASTRHAPDFRQFHLVKSTFHFLTKHGGLFAGPPILCFWTLVFLRSLLLDMGREGPRMIFVYCSGLAQGLSELARSIRA